ncbi:MAG: hypothetical protein H0T44_06875 [Gemmatimonadales bacterium]|nr:hypothetical protein [Gemmatimonadales bacterium]
MPHEAKAQFAFDRDQFRIARTKLDVPINVVCPKTFQLRSRRLRDGRAGCRWRPVDLAYWTGRKVTGIKKRVAIGIKDGLVGKVDEVGKVPSTPTVLVPVWTFFGFASGPTRCENPSWLDALPEEKHSRADRD